MKLQHVLAGLAVPCALFVAATPGVFADEHDKKTDVTISEPVEVPGGVVLQPGTYMFRLMEITGNRHVVQIRSEDGKKTYAIAMTAAAARVTPTSKVTLTFWEMPAGQPPALRKWFWPGDVDGQEFVYSHKRAQEISQASKETVPEASDEEQAAATQAANSADSTVSSNSNSSSTAAAAVDTSANNQPPAPAAPSSTNTTVAVNNNNSDNSAAAVAAAPAPQPEPQQLAQATPAPTPAPTYTAPAAQDQTPADSSSNSLPQTASDLPLIALVGGISLAAALGLRTVRVKA